jgi:hypothetical protein
VLKARIGNLVVLTLATTLAACGKQQPPAETAATPAAPAPEAQVKVEHPAPSTQAESNVDLTGIAKAEGGKTVAELFAEGPQLSGKSVTVRGKVVKTNKGIMDRNWLHVRDGSGAEGSNDLTVTTLGDLPAVGATVVVTGPLSVNKDFGMGYQYPVIIEGATITVESAGSQ